MSYPPLVSVGPLPASTLDSYRQLGEYKPIDTTRNSTTALTADPHLSVAAEPNAVYVATLRLVVNSGATPDFKWDLTVPTGASMARYIYLANVPPTGIEYSTLAAHSTVAAMACDGSDRPLIVSGTLVTASSAGSFALRWAQNTSDAGNTIVRAGSSLVLERVA